MRCFSHRSETALPSTRCSRRIATFCSGLKKRRLISFIEACSLRPRSSLASAHDFPIPSEAGQVGLTDISRGATYRHCSFQHLRHAPVNRIRVWGTGNSPRVTWIGRSDRVERRVGWPIDYEIAPSPDGHIHKNFKRHLLQISASID
jgi:hypothetical protein